MYFFLIIINLNPFFPVFSEPLYPGRPALLTPRPNRPHPSTPTSRFGAIIILFLFILYPCPFTAQKNTSQNIVPNPGFEEFSDYPLDWYYTGKDFARVALYWTSPNASSPDIYAPTVRIPPGWRAMGFGRISPFEGKAYAGITVYGCGVGKVHCREYVQIHLAEALVPGQQYGFSCRIAHLTRSVAVRNIGLSFSEYEWEEATHETIRQEPVLTLNRFIPSDDRWHRWTGHFMAKTAAPFLLIGNFSDDAGSTVRLPVRSDLRIGYYYLDDIQLFKIPPILPDPMMESPLRNFKPKPGEIVTLSRIFFEHDRSDFLPRAMTQLHHLLDFLRKYPTMRIDIIGHTDIVGTPPYNQQLSIRRAQAVMQWLVAQGINQNRLTYNGFGSAFPIATNETPAGRSQNRRVEIKVISL